MTEDQQQQALAAVRFNSAETPDDVWGDSPFHVEGLHTRVEARIRASVADAKNSRGSSPIGLTMTGQKGAGKTHLLGGVRRTVQDEAGYFFLIEITTGPAFWDDVVRSMRSELLRKGADSRLQLNNLLRRLCALAKPSEPVVNAVLGRTRITTDALNGFLGALRPVDAQVAVECADTIRALVLYGAADIDLADIGKDYLSGAADDDTKRKARRAWGLPVEAKPSLELAAEISRVLALTGPSVAAIDQLDSLINKATDEPPVEKSELSLIADGLIQLRQRARRTVTIVACLPTTWEQLCGAATDSFDDRFTDTPQLGVITNPELARTLVEKWLGVIYRGIDFTPPHPAWPVAAATFAEPWPGYTPRQLLRRIQTHAEACLHSGIRELTSFEAEPREAVDKEPPPPAEPGMEPDYFADFDRRFAELRESTDVDTILNYHTEDEVMPDLMQAALRCWITEVGNDDRAWETEPPDGGRNLHVGLLRVLDEETDVKERWMFRVFGPNQHGNRVLRRMRDARKAAGIGDGVRNRHLVLVHHGLGGWTGAVTTRELKQVERNGGLRVEISKDDVKTFRALSQLLTQQSYRLLNWLVARKPASRTSLLRKLLPDHGQPRGNQRETRPPPSPSRPANEDEITLGADHEIHIELESLRKHAVIFAGSGSGKTVLLRRIVEECALRGVSAIVLDPNNDLARLGDAWPDPPDDWGPGDAESAAEYIADTEVIVWTPGRSSGRPLSFHPLPDFAGVRDDADEFTAAVEAAVARLVPYARVAGGTKAAVRGKAVLREALTHYARKESRSLSGFVDVLAELPEGVSRLSTATKMAADLAETLRAAMVNDPLLGGTGTPVDPAALLTPAPGRRARISVISFIGLPSEAQRQGFVSQLQLEVFAWIKRNPAGDRPLGGLFVMDEAQTIAPSGAWTASTQSTIMLASQARKYGLGLLLATQAPKGLHNQITGNATTQFFGRLNSPAQVAAAKDMARAKGSAVGDISQLERGQFYVTGETFGFRRLRAPLCLSYHPPSPLRLEEVLDRARDAR
ncbi:ATP-binding protein [Amycolatopsis regifaucium]|uniref:AAA family ATPase n=1 Tax=Amycolatopsis regifaucium TaxID=546365 RepID=A0A154MHF0_9PSEU|nr:DUF87 domain-containing protein [Amycolatopsis regifaucium]KZB83914.1 AAA family ATPase [Amycolatopsis regifaucium]OKA06643.1 AAA family ATPase [Amycolatopsis regifaucium]SFH22561.1 AAA-like domain-containing protein [Amycolatopsis regifaucium]